MRFTFLALVAALTVAEAASAQGNSPRPKVGTSSSRPKETYYPVPTPVPVPNPGPSTPEPEGPGAYLGVTVVDGPDGNSVVIMGVAPNTPATRLTVRRGGSERGTVTEPEMLVRGDTITSLNGYATRNTSELKAALAKVRPNEDLAITGRDVSRHGRPMYEAWTATSAAPEAVPVRMGRMRTPPRPSVRPTPVGYRPLSRR